MKSQASFISRLLTYVVDVVNPFLGKEVPDKSLDLRAQSFHRERAASPLAFKPVWLGLNCALMLGVLVLSSSLALAASPFQSQIVPTLFDPENFDEWVDGHRKSRLAYDKSQQPGWVIWTAANQVGHSGLIYGDSKNPGPRHLRIGFKEETQVGSILTLGSGQVSVLRPDTEYPGDITDDSQWLPAQRIKNGRVSTEEAGRNDCVLWVLPQVTSTRALRFSHVAQDNDKIYAGYLGGCMVLPDRVVNLAPQAMVKVSANAANGGRLINESSDGVWAAWNNIEPQGQDRAQLVAENPEWILLSWPQPVQLDGLGFLGAGFSAGEIQTYIGPEDSQPVEAAEKDWQTLGPISGWRNLYPRTLDFHGLDFRKTITTKAIRLRITEVTDENPPHMKGKTRNGNRVWLGELMALAVPRQTPLKDLMLRVPEVQSVRPPIAIRFTAPAEGFATLVIENSQGIRVRNLVSQMPCVAGENVVYWDGTDDLGRDPEAASRGIYSIPAKFVEPGSYRVRGLWRPAIHLRYEFTVNSPGKPAWRTEDTSGGWTADHSPPGSMLFVPGQNAPGGKPLVYIGSFFGESGASLIWVDLNGTKIGGRKWIGGSWRGAPYIARDAGQKSDPQIIAYAASPWTAANDPKQGEIALTGVTKDGDKTILKMPYDLKAVTATDGDGKPDFQRAIGGIAVRDGIVVMSQTAFDKLLFIDAKNGKIISDLEIDDPRGVAFDAEGHLLVLSGKSLLRFTGTGTPADIGLPVPVVSDFQDPVGITLDATGTIYVADRGKSHQVKIYSPAGKLLKALGKPGMPVAGSYDELHMNNPRGIAVDSNGRIWVAEEDMYPKRVSVWNADGSLWKAYYGPPFYGGGGTLDARDSTRFYYGAENGGMEFKLDWASGSSRLVSVYARPEDNKQFRYWSMPDRAIHIDGRQYMTNCFNASPTSGAMTTSLWLMRDNQIRPVAMMGRAQDWPLLKQAAFAGRWPDGIKPDSNFYRFPTIYLWNDINEDGQPNPDEVFMKASSMGGVTVDSEGAFVATRVGQESKGTETLRLKVQRFTANGVPIYDFTKAETLAEGNQLPTSSGGDQALHGTDGWTVLTTAPKPFASQGLSGVKNGVPMWSYPSLWPGLHISHSAPVPQEPGQLVGTTRLVGDWVTPSNSESGPLFFLNGNHGNIYVFTQDGLFVANLFQDMRTGQIWKMPKSERGMLLDDVSPGDEHFFPTVNQTPDGKVYLVAGKDFSALVQVEGLNGIRRIAPIDLQVTKDTLRQATEYLAIQEIDRQRQQGTGVLKVASLAVTPKIDGVLTEWDKATWVDIDKRGVAAYFHSTSKPYNVEGSLALSGDQLVAAWKTGDPKLLRNSGQVQNAPFKTGGALDVMIGVDPSADPKRKEPVAGDVRVLITTVQGKTKAVLYRPVVTQAAPDKKVPFSSPWRTITMDEVQDVSDQVQLGADGQGNYEVAIPLSLLNLKAQPGLKLKGDLGILRGDGHSTIQRVYWANKAAGLVSDVPGEAMLTPGIWGTVEIQ